MSREGDSTSVRYAKLRLAEYQPGQPLTNEERRQLLDDADLVAKSEEADAARWTAILDANGIKRTSAPVKPTPRGSTPPSQSVAHLRRLFGDERDPARWEKMPAPMQRAIARAKAQAGVGLAPHEARCLEGSGTEVGMLGGRIYAKMKKG